MAEEADEVQENGGGPRNPGKRHFNVLFYISAAILARSLSVQYSYSFRKRVELNSITYSFGYLEDAVAIYDNGVDPNHIKGVTFHPVTIALFSLIFKHANSLLIPMWIIMDVATAFILSKAAKAVWEKKENKSVEDVEKMQRLVFIIYAFNPVTILSCGILSLTVVQNLIYASIFMCFVKEATKHCAVLIGLWTSFTCYPFILMSSLIYQSNQSTFRFIMLLLISVVVFIASNLVNYVVNGNSFSYVAITYETILDFTDIQPTVGLYWYFFVQIFEHFRSFYTHSFVLLYFFMPIPLSFYIRKDPILHFTIVSMIVSIFYPYPTLNSITVVFAILPHQEDYQKYFRYALLNCCTVIATIILMPVMWHMWIVSSSGNANFFFGATIVYNVALISIVMDLFFVYARRQIDIEYADSIKELTRVEFAFY